MYTAFYVFTVGEIVPRATTQEFMYSFLLESVCTIVNAIIIGYMTTYMDDLGAKSKLLSESINKTNSAILNLRLESLELKMDIKTHILNTHTTQSLNRERAEFLGALQKSLREKVTANAFLAMA